ncbi:hypothetical protein PHMEG_0002591 [Phytophthora megakarya]|uniref:Reverse transcriptase n=1 Tax=Phytophthora megakarya TaxID=4795 RepID=A0A225X052_9STRA|nr:hypothetical protein PHMEG_0002591 [Phytophthora megakarya]
MSLGPSGAKYMRSRVNSPDRRPAGPSRTPEKPDRQEERQIQAGRTTPTTNSTGSSNRLDEYFQMAMNRFLKEQSLVTVQPPPLGAQDIDMESIGAPHLHSWEYDPDDLGIPRSSGHPFSRAAVTSAAIGPGGSSLIQRSSISAISDLKEFTGKDMDEDRARAWFGKVKSAFQRDQATEEEKCLTFVDLMVGPAKNWHRQLSRTTKTKWVDLHENGNPKERLEHVDHYIETLGDPELADHLTLLRLADVDELEEVLRAREQTKSRQRRSAFGSKCRQQTPASAPATPARTMVRAIQAQDPSSKSEGVSGSDGSDSEAELRRIFLVAAEEKLISTGGASQNPDPARSRTKASEGGRFPTVATRERAITKIETAALIETHRSGLLEAPDMSPNGSLSVCVSWMGGVHEAGEYPMEEFYNQIRKWYDPTRHAGRFPQQTAKIASLPQISDFSRSNAEVALDLKRGESRGYWKRHAPGKWFRQPKISGRINQERVILLLDTDAEVSILDTTFARKVGCHFDTINNVYITEGRTRIKITLAGYLVYFFDIWIGDLSGQNAILTWISWSRPIVWREGEISDIRTKSADLGGSVGRNGGEDNIVSHKETVGGQRRMMVTEGPGRFRYLVISNIGDEILRLDHRLEVGIRTKYPDSQGSCPSCLVNLALESTVNTRSEPPELMEKPEQPAVQRPTYPTPRSILRRPETADIDRNRTSSNDHKDELYHLESGDLSAEDLDGYLAVLPKIPISTIAKVSIENLQVGDSRSATPEEIEKLRQIIWKKRHLLIDKANAQPPAAKGVMCGINADPLRIRKVPTRFREKVAGLIKGLLAAEIIRPSTSPWASPIVIVRKRNGVDIRLCIDYKLVNSLRG